MGVIGLHHLGLSVEDVERAVQGLGKYGFRGGPPFELASVDAARGNGLCSVRMRIVFLADGTSTLELIEHRDRRSEPVPAAGDSGFQRWQILPTHVKRLPRLPGVSVLPTTGGEGVQVTITARDVDATRALLRSIGVSESTNRTLTAPGVTIVLERATTTLPAPQVTARGRSHLAVRVDDARAAHERLLADGFDCVSEPIPHGAAVWWFFVRDPGGSGEIEIVEDRT